MTTLSPISSAIAIQTRSAVASSPATVIESADALPARPSATVSLGNPGVDVESQTYTRLGQLPGQEIVRVWEKTSQDAVTRVMGTNPRSLSIANRFQGLGAALVEQFAKSGTSISQSVFHTTQDKAHNAAEIKSEQTLLHNKADNLISLSIKTASGKTVTFSLTSQDDGLGVQATVDGGPLSEDELKAIGVLGSAFQAAVDGLTAEPPKLDLGKLTQFDSSVLASIDLNAKLKGMDGEDLTLAYRADSQSRTTQMRGPDGELNLSVDLKNSAILGDAKQQANALNSYLAQFDRVQERGSAKAALMEMFKDAFSAMNSHYPQGATPTEPLTRNAADKGLLTGLADFEASITQTHNASNPMRLSEVDSFAYNLSQKTLVKGSIMRNRSIDQVQQSSLSASYHKSLKGGKAPVLGTTPDSQNYRYVEVNDKASSSASLAYKDGRLTRASVTQNASQDTRTQQYVMGKMVEETVVPKEASTSRSHLVLLEYAAKESKKSKDAQEQSLLKEALATLHNSVLLQENPSALAR
ncbi:lactate dehydrogenase [Pseudomonas brassicacearum]|uniref:lactate dehydrogenase n=1 Tax=Pseudomonas brassicacearum TaxID=930166 RepID=UPI0020C82286|nr:lactate dehydrogenase [Pseudomonas brassicacearum]